MALAQRDASAAATALGTALDALPTADVADEGVTVKFYLGEALWESGRRDDAADYFRGVAESELPRVQQPDQWVRSLWYLGEYHAERGDTDDALDYFERFLEYWSNSEVDRDRVERAQAFVEAND
ncbi:MAG: tetratricopeptide repeat protein [Acidobacteria bacterium]|nr:tetratricopeptide repeat protein [Acidobacteriota bacterium]